MLAHHQMAPVLLVVTGVHLCAFDAADGELAVALDLIDVECWSDADDPTAVLVRPTPAPNHNPTAAAAVAAAANPMALQDEFNPHYDFERVAEFVRQTTPFVLPAVDKQVLSEFSILLQYHLSID